MQTSKNERAPMNNRLDELFFQLQARGRKALTVFLMGGDPDLETSLKLLRASLEGGADIVEIGVPFSDPLADGPVIQKASQRARVNQTTLADIFSLVRELRKEHDTPIVLLSYWNPIYQYGPEQFFQQAKKIGVDGLVIPDLPYEEKRPFRPAAEACGLVLIDFMTPLTGEERAQKILQQAAGFIYCVTVSGVTGVRDQLAETLEKSAAIVRNVTRVPLLAGFGISSPAQARQAVQWTEGVIVGSALVQEVENHLEQLDALPERIREQVRGFRRALDP